MGLVGKISMYYVDYIPLFPSASNAGEDVGFCKGFGLRIQDFLGV